MFRRLLVPLDGSRLAEAVLPAAACLAERAGATVTLIHVLERAAPPTVHGERHLTGVAEAKDYLDEVARHAFAPAAEVERHVHDHPERDLAESLLAHVREFRCDLVIMCAHGRTRLRDLLYGNIAQQIVEKGDTPVLLLGPGPSGEIRHPFRRALVPLDGQEAHEGALPLAAGLAKLCGMPIHLLFVVPTVLTLSGARAITGSLLPGATSELLVLEEQRAAEYLAKHIARLQADGIDATGSIGRGIPADVIERSVVDLDADLVAFGTHGKAGSRAFWEGSLTAKLVGRLRASLLLAPVSGE